MPNLAGAEIKNIFKMQISLGKFVQLVQLNQFQKSHKTTIFQDVIILEKEICHEEPKAPIQVHNLKVFSSDDSLFRDHSQYYTILYSRTQLILLFS